jgi:hypothetical protein
MPVQTMTPLTMGTIGAETGGGTAAGSGGRRAPEAGAAAVDGGASAAWITNVWPHFVHGTPGGKRRLGNRDRLRTKEAFAGEGHMLSVPSWCFSTIRHQRGTEQDITSKRP